MSTVESAAQVVSVTVRVSGGNVVCSPDPVNVRAHDTTLVFKLAAPGYRFRDTHAIVVSDGGTEFPTPSQTGPGGLSATLADCCDCKGRFKYSVYLVDPSGKPVMVDPEINNDPD